VFLIRGGTVLRLGSDLLNAEIVKENAVEFTEWRAEITGGAAGNATND